MAVLLLVFEAPPVLLLWKGAADGAVVGGTLGVVVGEALGGFVAPPVPPVMLLWEGANEGAVVGGTVGVSVALPVASGEEVLLRTPDREGAAEGTSKVVGLGVGELLPDGEYVGVLTESSVGMLVLFA